MLCTCSIGNIYASYCQVHAVSTQHDHTMLIIHTLLHAAKMLVDYALHAYL